MKVVVAIEMQDVKNEITVDPPGSERAILGIYQYELHKMVNETFTVGFRLVCNTLIYSNR